jgi:hypothetical protein
MLEDGTYDAVIVDAEERDDGALHLELTIVAGDRKGDVVAVTARGLGRDALDVLGLPVTVTVEDGAPRVVVEG